jgi:hypothetical protein
LIYLFPNPMALFPFFLNLFLHSSTILSQCFATKYIWESSFSDTISML